MLATVGFLALTILPLPGRTAEPAWGSLAMGGALAALSSLAFFNSGFAQRARGVAALLVAFVTLQLLGGLESFEPYRSQLSLANWLVGLTIFFALVMGIENLTQWKAVCALLVGVASLFSLRWLLQPGADAIADKLALVPMTAALMGFSLGGEAESAWQRWLIRGTQLLLILGLMKSESKGAVIGLVAGLLTFAFLSTLGARATLLALASLIAVALATQGPVRWQQALTDGHLHFRKELTASAWEAAQERLLLGNGPATFALGHQKYRPAGLLPESTPIDTAHDDYLELAVEMGLAGLATWLWLLGAAFHRGYRFAWFSDLEDEPAGVTAALAAVAVFSLLDSALAEPVLVWWLCALLGLIVSLPVSPDHRRPWPLAAHLMVGACLVIGGLWTLQMA